MEYSIVKHAQMVFYTLFGIYVGRKRGWNEYTSHKFTHYLYTETFRAKQDFSLKTALQQSLHFYIRKAFYLYSLNLHKFVQRTTHKLHCNLF